VLKCKSTIIVYLSIFTFNHEPASNSVINAEEKEISQLTKEYTEQIKKKDEEITGQTVDLIRTEIQ
jgi:hypothetical protein